MTGYPLGNLPALVLLAALAAVQLPGSDALLAAGQPKRGQKTTRRIHEKPARGHKKADPGAPSETCRFPACVLHGGGAPRVFVNEHGDGAGHRLKNVLDGMAVAQKNGMNFGGIYSTIQDHVTEHGVDFVKLVGKFFGNASYDPGEFFFYRKSYAMTAKYDSFLVFERNREQFINTSANIFLPSVNGFGAVNVSEYYTDRFRGVLGAPLARLPLKFAPGRLPVAIHLRRGDLERDDHRITPDSYYYDIVDRINAAASNMTDVHVWSSTDPGKNKQHQQPWHSSDFDGYRARGMTVHLDDTDLTEVWAHLARAAVYLMGASSFSYIPAVVNRRCVIYPGVQASPLGNWLDGTRLGGPRDGGLEGCIEAGTPKSSLPVGTSSWPAHGR